MGAESPKDTFSDENRQTRVLDEGSGPPSGWVLASGRGVAEGDRKPSLFLLCILLGQLVSGVHMSLYSWKAVFLLSL